MATTDYHHAMSGLRVRRVYMRLTFPFRQFSRTATLLMRLCRTSVCGLLGRKVPVRKPELFWTKDHVSVAERIAEAILESSGVDETGRERGHTLASIGPSKEDRVDRYVIATMVHGEKGVLTL